MKKLITCLSVVCIALIFCACWGPENISTDSGTPTSSTPEATYILDVTAEGGTVPAGLSGTYPESAKIELIAYPNPGFRFYRWVVSSSDPEFSWTISQNPAQFTMPWHDVSVVAVFKDASELFHLEIIDGGGLLHSGNYLEGETARCILRPRPFLGFQKWIIYSSDFEILGTMDISNTTFVMPPYDVILVAEYKEPISYYFYYFGAPLINW